LGLSRVEAKMDIGGSSGGRRRCKKKNPRCFPESRRVGTIVNMISNRERDRKNLGVEHRGGRKSGQKFPGKKGRVRGLSKGRMTRERGAGRGVLWKNQ